MTKKEGKKPMPIAKEKKPKAQIVREYIFVQNTNQNPKLPTEKIVGWCYTDKERKSGLVLWYLARTSGDFPNQSVVLTAPSGRGKPAEFPPST
eukprot:283522-Prymnesium_polylepis.1